ncbi:MAG: glycosyltransferase family 9 protein, partial [Dehalococcoidia bacterium]
MDDGAAHGFVDGVTSIAVLRANGIGDLIFALPALDALKRTYPAAKLTLLAKGWHQELLVGRPGPVDEVIVIPHGILASDADATVDAEKAARFFARLQGERYSIAMQMHGGGRHSNPFVLSMGADLTVGLKAPGAPPLDRWISYVYFQREVLRYLELTALVG